jgi:predicted DCC family thiol-disulfide oxidoreductase YuxK
MCNSFIQFVHRYDIDKKIYFSDFHSQLALDLNLRLADNSMVFYANGIKHYRSSAFIEILKQINFPKTVIAIIEIIPQKFRDFIYSFIANNRHKIFTSNTKSICSLDIQSKIIK